jgi:hypothetical protein
MKRWKFSVVGAIAVLIALPAFGTDLSLFLLTLTLAFIAGLLMAGKWLGK